MDINVINTGNIAPSVSVTPKKDVEKKPTMEYTGKNTNPINMTPIYMLLLSDDNKKNPTGPINIKNVSFYMKEWQEGTYSSSENRLKLNKLPYLDPSDQSNYGAIGFHKMFDEPINTIECPYIQVKLNDTIYDNRLTLRVYYGNGQQEVLNPITNKNSLNRGNIYASEDNPSLICWEPGNIYYELPYDQELTGFTFQISRDPSNPDRITEPIDLDVEFSLSADINLSAETAEPKMNLMELYKNSTYNIDSGTIERTGINELKVSGLKTSNFSGYVIQYAKGDGPDISHYEYIKVRVSNASADAEKITGDSVTGDNIITGWDTRFLGININDDGYDGICWPQNPGYNENSDYHALVNSGELIYKIPEGITTADKIIIRFGTFDGVANGNANLEFSWLEKTE